MDISISKKENKKKKMKAKTKMKGGKKKMFGKKKNKDKPVAPPPVEDAILPEDSEEAVNLKNQIAELETKTQEIKQENPVPDIEPNPEQPKGEQPDEELTEDKVKAILMNFEQRLQKIEYNLRLIP